MTVAQADPDVHEGDGELVGQPFEVVGHLPAVAAVHVQEVDVVDHDEGGSCTTTRSPAARLASSVALPRSAPGWP